MFSNLYKYSCTIVQEVFTLVQIVMYYGSGIVYSDMISSTSWQIFKNLMYCLSYLEFDKLTWQRKQEVQ